MLRFLFCLIFLYIIFNNSISFGQNYIDTAFAISTQSNIIYGNAVNFAGQEKQLELDYSAPINDVLPECGRPLVVIVHGGAWIAGSKDDLGIIRLREDFAKRGFASAAINYRLGFFLTNDNPNCNVPNWNCLLAADSSEWIRAWYRGVQDAKMAIRFLVEHQNEFQIDADQIFVLGESAGGFIALGAGFLDSEAEKPLDCSEIQSVLAPNQNFYAPCIQNASWAQDIGTMNLNRPDLGGIDGEINPLAPPFKVKAIANMFGGMLMNLFQLSDGIVPDLYTFHQPNDLIVAIGSTRLLQGYSECSVGSGCINLPKRPWCWGSQAIANIIQQSTQPIQELPTVQIEVTSNTSPCIVQAFNPETGGHQYDNYYLRTSQAASFFAQRIETSDSCIILKSIQLLSEDSFKIYAHGKQLFIESNSDKGTGFFFHVYSSTGFLVKSGKELGEFTNVQLDVDSGLYWVNVFSTNGTLKNKGLLINNEY